MTGLGVGVVTVHVTELLYRPVVVEQTVELGHQIELLHEVVLVRDLAVEHLPVLTRADGHPVPLAVATEHQLQR
ncbi:MAG: hypothetical protein H0X35_11740 [Pseudonocardiales bacterium]|nr:hypothetical protein [Pseudonocardiales bacterium]